MGRRHRATVRAAWAPVLGSRALLLAVAIADSVPDDSVEWWGGQRWSAEVMGVWEPGLPWTAKAERAVSRAVAELIAAGFLERTSRGMPGHRATFVVTGFKPPL